MTRPREPEGQPVPTERRPRLPHAAPFILLDRVVRIEPDLRHGVFEKMVSAADPCLGADGLRPAAFVQEALAQAGGALLAETKRDSGAYLAAVDDFRLHVPVRAGDTIRIEVELARVFGVAYHLRARAFVGDTLSADGRLTLVTPR